MINLKQIKTNDAEHYSYVESLLVSSFPKEERRELDLQRRYVDENPLFQNHLICDNDTPIGLITYWDFKDFYYIEHFAIDPIQRNGGMGQKVLNYLHEKLSPTPIVLEVEVPIDEMSTRRVGFYQRLNYILWEKSYLQPPYRKGDNYIPMHLMAYGHLDCERDFVHIQDLLYKNVYGVSDQV